MGQVVRKGMNGMRIGLRLRVLLNTLVVMVFVAVCVTSAFAQAMEAQPHESLENLACGNCHLGVTGGNPFHDAIPNLLDAGQRLPAGFLSTIGLGHGRRAKKSTWGDASVSTIRRGAARFESVLGHVAERA